MNDKDALFKHSLNERKRVMTSGKPIVLFDTATALLVSSHITLHPLANDLVFIESSIIKTYIWDIQSNTSVTTIDYSILSHDLDIMLNNDNNKPLLQKVIQEPLGIKPMPITVDYITVKPSSNIFGNTNQCIIGNKNDSALSNVINFNSPGTIGSYDKHSFDDIIRLNDKYIAALFNDSIMIYDVSESSNNQCNIVVVLHKRKNCYLCLFDLINGRIKEPRTIKHQIHRHSNSNSNSDTLAYDLNNHCVLLVSGIPKKFQLFKLELYHSIKHLTDNDGVIRIDKIGNKDQYLFVMMAYDFYVYDINAREYIQKIPSLMTTEYCISKNYLIYYSKVVCYSVKINLKGNKKDNSLSNTIY